MAKKEFRRGNPRAYEENVYAWHIGRTPEKIVNDDGNKVDYPTRVSGVFLVHGIGEQNFTETAAQLRSGFEDALVRIRQWQHEQGIPASELQPELPPPYIREGFWADYPDIRKTFPEDCNRFTPSQLAFFEKLWAIRILKPLRTVGWMLKQQFSLLHPRVICEVGLWAWLMYWPLQITSTTILLFALLRYPKIITGFLTDIRLYLDPRGIVERAIVQRIDRRVGQRFLAMLGLGWDFRPLTGKHKDKQVQVDGKPVTFQRIVWVAHSLGTVISYNVISDLFTRATEIMEATKGRENNLQRQGAKIFLGAIKRFVTLGSPLDKVAFLFPRTALRPWPPAMRDKFMKPGKTGGKWWVNFYDVFDPVSGPLESIILCGDNPPTNLHTAIGNVPGYAHVAYWKDIGILRFILGRTYGPVDLPDQTYGAKPHLLLNLLAFIFQLIQAGIAAGIFWLACRAIADWRGFGEIIQSLPLIGR